MKKLVTILTLVSAAAVAAENSTCQPAAVSVLSALGQASFGSRGEVFSIDGLKKVSEDDNQVTFEAVVEGGSSMVEKILLGTYTIVMSNDASMKCVVRKVELK